MVLRKRQKKKDNEKRQKVDNFSLIFGRPEDVLKEKK
jgi:hypothetical protein